MPDARGLLRALKWDALHGASMLRRQLPHSLRWRNIVFIVGCGRSGTTLLGELVAAHPGVRYLNEPRDRWAAVSPATDDIDLFGTGVGKLCLSENDATPEQAIRFLRLFGNCDPRARRTLVEKLPQNCFRLPWLRRLAPHAKFVHIVRNWPDVVTSITRLSLDTTYAIAGRPSLNRWWGTRYSKLDHFIGELAETELLPVKRSSLSAVPATATEYDKLAACEWYASVRAVRGASEALGPDYLEIRYEDLVREPAKVLGRVFDFAELAPAPMALDIAEQRVRRSPAEVPVPLEIEGSLLDACDKLAGELGYARTGRPASAPGIPTAPTRATSNARVAIVFERFGPYHQARARAAAERLPVQAIEVYRRDSTYAWDTLPEHADYPTETLFPDPAGAGPRAERHGRIWRALDRAAPTVVAIPGWSHWYALAPLAWARRRGVRVVVMSETTLADRGRPLARELAKRVILAGCDAALVGGTPQWRYLVELGMPPERIELGYDAVDNEYFIAGSDAARREDNLVRERLALPRDYFLASCRFVHRKNLDGLLREYALYRHREGVRAYDLVLLGDGPEKGALQALAAELGITDAVRFMGFRQYPELPAFYGLARAFVLPSLTEPWGLVVNEAMAAGLPVIVSDTAGCARDLVVPGRTGWRFRPDQPGALADLLSTLGANSAEATQMGREARRHIQAWGPARFAEGLARACNTALERPRPPLSNVATLLLDALAYR